MTEPHPFAAFVRILGRGARLSRSLDAAEAEQAMAMVLGGDVEPAQLGAFLALLRYRGETPEELTGFVRAARAAIARPSGPPLDLDWPSYADRHKQLPWFVLSALLLAENGVRVLMHGIPGETDGHAPTPAALARLGIRSCRSLDEAAAQLADGGFAFVLVDDFCPALGGLFRLRPLLGVRTVVNSLARELNPMAAPCQMQGVFHPTYLAPHQRAAQLLGQPRCAVFKGGGGEAQRNPEKPCRVATLLDGTAGEEIWPALAPDAAYPWREETGEMERLPALWAGRHVAPAAEAAVVGTAAIALRVLGRAASMEEADRLAARLWRARPKQKYAAGLAVTA
jgi:anthranilate phosphoribosyltransferase